MHLGKQKQKAKHCYVVTNHYFVLGCKSPKIKIAHTTATTSNSKKRGTSYTSGNVLSRPPSIDRLIITHHRRTHHNSEKGSPGLFYPPINPLKPRLFGQAETHPHVHPSKPRLFEQNRFISWSLINSCPNFSNRLIHPSHERGNRAGPG